MKLTWKAREALSEWLKTSDDFYNTTVEQLESYHESMQYGVLKDFFYSAGVLVEFSLYETTVTIIDYNHHIEEQVYEFNVMYEFENSKNYIDDYRIFAINRAVEIFNERH